MASQQHFSLSPSYTGPMVLADTLRKMKTNTGLNRMLSAFNKRFFVLDLNHGTFYYLPDKGAHFTNATDIPLSSIINIRVTKQAEGLEEDRIWKHEFVITTKKKTLELISDSKPAMDKMLFAFGHLINIKTKKPLFDWDAYSNSRQNQSSPTHLPLAKSPVCTPQKEKEETFTSPEKSPIDIKTFQPEQRGEATPELANTRKFNQEEATEPSPNKESCESDDQKENKQGQCEIQKKQISIQLRRKGNSFAASRGKGFKVEGQQEEKVVQQESVHQQEASPQKSEHVELKQEKEEEEEEEQHSPMEKVEKIQIKLEMLNLDKIESDLRSQDVKPLGSNRDVSKKYSSGEQADAVRRNSSRLLMKNSKSASVKAMVKAQDDFVGFNEIDLSHQKAKTGKHSELYNVQGHASARTASEKTSFGTGVTREAAKFSLFKQSSENVTVKRSEVNDDDWDNEMFGEGNQQLSPLKPTNSEQKQRQSYESKYMSSEKKKQQLAQRRNEYVASRQGTHNDWDDDL